MIDIDGQHQSIWVVSFYSDIVWEKILVLTFDPVLRISWDYFPFRFRACGKKTNSEKGHLRLNRWAGRETLLGVKSLKRSRTSFFLSKCRRGYFFVRCLKLDMKRSTSEMEGKSAQCGGISRESAPLLVYIPRAIFFLSAKWICSFLRKEGEGITRQRIWWRAGCIESL